MRRRSRWGWAVGRVGLIASGLLLLTAGSASAHAYPVATSPAVGAVVSSSPKLVSITYDESVSDPSLAVYSAAGRLVSAPAVAHPAADRIDVTISGSLNHGTYTVAWRVTSADTHVVHGIYTFSVGRRGAAGRIGAELLARQALPGGLAFGFGVVRFLNLALMLICSGGAIAIVWVLSDADADVRRLLLRGFTIAGLLLAIVAVLGLPFEAAEADGTGLGSGFARLAIYTVRHQRFGELWLIRAWLAVLFAMNCVSLQVWEVRWRRERHWLLAAVGICLLLTSTDSGHAGVAGAGTFIADAFHITAAATWLGGLLAVVAAILLSRADKRWELASVSVGRFSLMAMTAVPILGATGIISAYLEIGTWRGLWQTTYGVLVLTKIVIVLPLLALGAFNNRVSVPKLKAAGESAPTRSARTGFVRAVVTELALLLIVVGVTAALVDEAPAKTLLRSNRSAPDSVSRTTRRAGPFKLIFVVRPARAGSNEIQMTVISAHHLPIGEVDLGATPPGGGTVDLNVAQRSSTEFVVPNARLRQAGRWDFEVTVRYGLAEWLMRIPVRIARHG